MARKLTTEEVVSRFKALNGDKYDYSEFVYVNAKTKGKIICPKHGEFYQSSNVHLKGVQCPVCAKESVKRSCYRLYWKKFIEIVGNKHNGKYLYTYTDNISGNSIIEIECPIHGKFKQKISNHLSGQGCPKCGSLSKSDKMSLKLDLFIEKADNVHNGKYDYSLVSFNNTKDYIKIICPIHGEFEMKVNTHLSGRGCPKCSGKKRTFEEFVSKAKEVHGDRYDYSMVEYEFSCEKVVIVCKKCGNTFTQKPWSHLQGHGCPHCKISRGERDIEMYLNNKGIKFIHQKRFEWLGNMSLDFYLTDYQCAIEVQGEQHFNENTKYSDEKTFERDNRKYKLCIENGIKIYYYVFDDFKLPQTYIDEIYRDKERMIEMIIQTNSSK